MKGTLMQSCRLALVASVMAATTPLMAQNADVKPQRGGTFIYSVSQGDPTTFDCHASSSITTMMRVAPHYSTLLQVDSRNFPNVIGDLAKSWEVSDDALVYTFKLHPNVKFHDGSNLTSHDVKVSFERLRNPPAGVVSSRQGLYADIASIETPAEDTIVFRLSEPNSAMLKIFAAPTGCIYSAEMLKNDPDYPARKVMGSGPFKFVNYMPASEWTGERFDDYFIEGLPYLDGFKSLTLTTPAMVNALSAGQIMTDFRGVAKAEVSRIVSARGDKVQVYDTDEATNLLLLLIFNHESDALKDERVRRAIALALDHWGGSKLVQRSTGTSAPGAFLRPGSEFARSDDELSQFPGFRRDMKEARAEARRLLEEAGHKNLQLTFLNRRPFPYVGVFLIDQLRQIGITVNHEQPEDPQFFARRDAGNFDIILSAFPDFEDDPTVQWSALLSYSKNPLNFGRFNDETFDALYAEQKRSMDFEQRKALLQKAEAHLLNTAHVAPFFWGKRSMVIDSRVQGFTPTPSNWVSLDLAEFWLKQE